MRDGWREVVPWSSHRFGIQVREQIEDYRKMILTSCKMRRCPVVLRHKIKGRAAQNKKTTACERETWEG